eukprot:1161921-Pelagomonas_calceolata.AAC.20
MLCYIKLVICTQSWVRSIWGGWRGPVDAWVCHRGLLGWPVSVVRAHMLLRMPGEKKSTNTHEQLWFCTAPQNLVAGNLAQTLADQHRAFARVDAAYN